MTPEEKADWALGLYHVAVGLAAFLFLASMKPSCEVRFESRPVVKGDTQ